MPNRSEPTSSHVKVFYVEGRGVFVEYAELKKENFSLWFTFNLLLQDRAV